MDRLDRYIRRDAKRIEGWLNPLSATVIAELARWQSREGIRGAAAEIGVHHGKLFILLHLQQRPAERSLAVDVFDAQHLAHGHYRGSRETFLANVRSYGGDGAVEIIQQPSQRVSADDIVERVGRVRLFSIDGGHTAAITKHDLRLAEHSLCDDGLVILDDAFNFLWPGVMTGLVEYLRDGSLQPVGMSPNKLYLALSPEQYRTRMHRLHLRGVWEDEFLRHAVVVIPPNPSRTRSLLSDAYDRLPQWKILHDTVERLRPSLTRLIK